MEKARFHTALTNSLLRSRTRRDALWVLGAAAAYSVAVYLAISLTRNSTSIAAIWPANGIMLAALLACRRAQTRHALVIACILANAIACLLNGDPWMSAVLFPLISAAESLLAFHLLRYSCGKSVDFTKAGTVVTFVIICFAVPVLPSAIGAGIALNMFGAHYNEAFTTWYLADTLGLLVLTPAILLLWPKTRVSGPSPPMASVVRHMVLLVTVSSIVFFQSSAPLLFLLVPVSVLIAFRLGPRYAAMATLWLTFVSLTTTYQGWGPAALMEDPGTRLWVAQLFCFVNLLTALPIAAEITDRDRLRRELERVSELAYDRRRQLDTALDAMSQGVCLFDRHSRVVVRNNQFLAIYSLTEEAVPAGMSLSDLMAVCQAAGSVPEVNGRSVELNVNNDLEQQLVDGRYIRISQRVLSDGGVICTYTDFTAEKQAETELLHRTLHDILTGLPNRRLLVDRIERALAAARRGRQTAVMLIDVDYFKSINDNLGHAAGDELLRGVAERLRSCVRETDTVARLGGDEFAVLLTDEQPCDAAIVARRILESIRRPVVIEGKQLRIGVSIGIAQPPLDGITTDEILKSADVALYKAKRNGRGNFAFFDAAEDAGACSARRLESELRRAIDEKEFRLVYQPITAGDLSGIAALEALIRWHHPELGTISPAEFIPIAERNGLISEIGDWVLDQACRDALRLPENVKVSVNLSRAQVSDRNFVSRVSQALTRTGLAPGRLELEVTETAILDNEVTAGRMLQDLCALGVSVAIDDFGVGQSALSCLKSLPIGRIKIDRSFVSDLETDSKARSIFVAVVSLAKSLGIKTTAEGIETEQQRMIAALAGCDHLQGYLLGRPQDLDGIHLEADVKKLPKPALAG
ncbi:bifunctional diguanylate cyclase/phosphodiesterase [Hyphomicrobium sp.]|uniref:bifunctional diguanylate cyclase/phosphodiesterase n=1 Tax=Hyphomicrobium sp. TaxID=82 RepID=UPI002E345D04|nr:EAL domain-containing protein [Hyphomicrobium sp.]HEX2839673.1 EAL domain-containing protein [Hyphomicrobium sp.]